MNKKETKNLTEIKPLSKEPTNLKETPFLNIFTS